MRPVLLSLLAACASSTIAEKPGPRGLRADQHLNVASREDGRADELTRWPDTRPGPDGMPALQLTASAWFGTWDTVAEHHRLAQIHRSAAGAIQSEYEEACRDTPAEKVMVSPLQRWGIGGSDTENGTIVLLTAEAGPPERLLEAMRCHRAWMMLQRTDMDDCPLDLPGLKVHARGDADGIELTMTVVDAKLVPELRRRAAHDLEASHHTAH